MRRWLIACGLAGLLGASAGHAGILVEGRLNERLLRIEFGSDADRIRVAVDGVAHLVDVGRRKVYRFDGERWRPLDGGADIGDGSFPAFVLDDWSGGPPVAGHGSRFNVLRRGAAVCGEVLASPWMRPFMAPAVEAMDILIQALRDLRPEVGGDCGTPPFSALAANGWPLVIGWRETGYFATDAIRFDHQPPSVDPAAAP